jgi:hypothetical protein
MSISDSLQFFAFAIFNERVSLAIVSSLMSIPRSSIRDNACFEKEIVLVIVVSPTALAPSTVFAVFADNSDCSSLAKGESIGEESPTGACAFGKPLTCPVVTETLLAFR